MQPAEEDLVAPWCGPAVPVSSPGLGWSSGISCWFTPFHAWQAAGPVFALPVQLPISYRNSQLLFSIKSPGIDEGLVRDFNLAQIIGLNWNLLPVSFRLANTNSFCTSTTGHSATWSWSGLLATAVPSAIGFLICVCKRWVLRANNLLQQLLKLRQIIYSS